MKNFAKPSISLLCLCLSLSLVAIKSDAADENAVLHQAVSKPWKVVNYWSLHCAPCRLEIPELNLLQKDLASFNVAILGVNFDEDPRDKTLQIAKRMGIEFPTLRMTDVEALGLSPPNVLPSTYILSPDNEVKAKLSGIQDRASIKARLAELNVTKH